MTLETHKKLVQHICRLLKVTYVQVPVGRTDKGNFGIIFNENGDWDIMLDSVPLSTKNILTDENNIELKRMVEKYLFEQEKIPNFQEHTVERYEEATAVADKMMEKVGHPAKPTDFAQLDTINPTEKAPKSSKAPIRHINADKNGKKTNK